jgi:alkylhydroperoxidase family enzyme
MSWVPLRHASGEGELTALLDLHPETAVALRDLVEAARASIDAELLELCLRRAATLHGLDPNTVTDLVPLGAASPERVAELSNWHRSPSFDAKQREAIGFAEQYTIDHTSIGPAMIERLLEVFGAEGLFRLATAFGVIDRILRMCRLFELQPGGATP